MQRTAMRELAFKLVYGIEVQKETTEEQLVNALLKEYDVDEELARKDVNAFINKLAEAGLTE